MHERWISAPLETRPGIYAIYVEGSLLYIGQSTSVFHRVGYHRWIGHRQVTVKVSYHSDGYTRRKREFRLIARLRPPMNFYRKRSAGSALISRLLTAAAKRYAK